MVNTILEQFLKPFAQKYEYIQIFAQKSWNAYLALVDIVQIEILKKEEIFRDICRPRYMSKNFQRYLLALIFLSISSPPVSLHIVQDIVLPLFLDKPHIHTQVDHFHNTIYQNHVWLLPFCKTVRID